MRRLPIYRDRIYLFREVPGISRFKRYGTYNYGIASGAIVKSRGLETMFSGGPGNLNALTFETRGEGHFDNEPPMTFDAACALIQSGQIRAAFVAPVTRKED